MWASGKDRKVVGQPLHTNFELNATDEGVGIVNPQGVLVDSHRWTAAQVEDSSAGWGIDNYVGQADGRTRKLRYFGVPTPSALNTERAYTGVCEKVTFSNLGGVITAQNLSISLASNTPGAVIRFTTDFTTPTDSSTVYTAPISVSSTTSIRAVATSPGCVPSPVITRSYLYKEKVLGTAAQGVLPTDHQIKPVGWSDATSILYQVIFRI